MKKILKKWLGITKIENELEEANREIKSLSRSDDLDMSFKEGINNIENLKRYFEIGLDISPYDRESWCVICVKGKQERVTFANLNGHDIQEISRFLKQFQLDQRNVFVDSPFSKRMLW